MSKDDRTLWVGNLSDKVDKDLLYELFLQAGPIENVTYKKPDSGKNAYGFVTFTHEVSPGYALALLDGVTLYGRTLNMRSNAKKPDHTYTQMMADYFRQQQQQQHHQQRDLRDHLRDARDLFQMRDARGINQMRDIRDIPQMRDARDLFQMRDSRELLQMRNERDLLQMREMRDIRDNIFRDPFQARDPFPPGVAGLPRDPFLSRDVHPPRDSYLTRDLYLPRDPYPSRDPDHNRRARYSDPIPSRRDDRQEHSDYYRRPSERDYRGDRVNIPDRRDDRRRHRH